MYKFFKDGVTDKIIVENTKGKKQNPGLSSLSSNYTTETLSRMTDNEIISRGLLREYTLPMLLHAATLVPQNYHDQSAKL